MPVLVNKEEITSYIPQKQPIVLIDTLDACDENSAVTSYQIRPEAMFVKEGLLHEPGIIENIAQTAAAKAGYEYRKKGLRPPPGFIGAIKDLKIHALPKIHQTLKTRVNIKAEVMGVTLIQGISECEGHRIAECEMKIFLQKAE